MKKATTTDAMKPWHRKPSFGSLYLTKGSKYIYVSINYFKQRLRCPTDLEDTPKNWEELCDFLKEVGEKIRNRTFRFAKAFYWVDEKTKEHFTMLEGNDYKPEAEHILIGDYARDWMTRKIPTFTSVTKREYYSKALNSRVVPYFDKKSFASITCDEIEAFIDSLKRKNNPELDLSVKRIKNIVCPLATVWQAACDDNNWTLRNPFSCVPAKYGELKDRAMQKKEHIAMLNDGSEDTTSRRDIFLLAEWEQHRSAIDPHYHLVLELLLRGVIGSELEGLQKIDVKGDSIVIRRSVVHEKDGKLHLKFKPKNWYRKREIPLTDKMRPLVADAMAKSTSTSMIHFEDGIEFPANSFLLTMLDGSPFNYDSFRDLVWNKAMKRTGLPHRIPYASRHTFVQWALLVGVNKSRQVDLMGHSTKKMIDEVYGKYRKGLIDERERILDYLGEDFLSVEELKTAFPERYQRKVSVPVIPPRITKAPDVAIAFGQSFGQSQGLYADNYL
jgi:integrase